MRRRTGAGGRGFGAVLAAAALALTAPAAAEELYGLVVGIDDYLGTENDLEGATNDARGIAAALREAQAADVRLLLDGAATKAAVESAWRILLASASPGDTIVFSYAGHGSQEPERPGRNGEADGLNENFLLAGYQPIGPDTRERIVDDEINAWLLDAERKGVEVVFVADSCHSGTMFRTAGSRHVRYRTGRFTDPDLAADLLALPPPAAARIAEEDFSRVTFIAATQDGMLTPELILDGIPHGALSWAFAKAVRGAADRDNDGRLSQQELLSYLVPTVQTEAENQQIPGILPLRPNDRPIMRAAGGPDLSQPGTAHTTLVEQPLDTTQPAAPPPPPSDPTAVGLFVAGGHTAPPVAGVEVVAAEAAADLIWNPAAGTVDHRVGGRVAENIVPGEIAAVLSKWSALAFIKARASDNPVAVSVPSGNQTYARGDMVVFAIDDIHLPHLTLFNLPPNGRVEFFLPANDREAVADWRGRLFRERFQVTRPPYGAEHMVAILTDRPAYALHQALRSMPTAANAGGLATTLRALLAETSFQAGVTAIYTSEAAP